MFGQVNKLARQKSLMSTLQNRAGMNVPKRTAGSVEAFVTSLSNDLYNNPQLSDVILRVEGKDYHVHKFLLAHFSDVMKTMLLEARWGDAQKHVVELSETAEAAAVFDAFLKFMYCGQIQLNIATTLPVLALADKYDVRSLKAACEGYMSKEIVECGNVRGALLWWQQTSSYNSVALDPDCFDIIAQSLDEALVAPEWQTLNFHQICAILKCSESIVSSEHYLFQAVASWIQALDESENIEEIVGGVLPFIRFTFMTPEEIESVEKSPLYEKFQSKFAPHLYKAFKHHAMKSKSGGVGFVSGQSLDEMPRCYTYWYNDTVTSQSSSGYKDHDQHHFPVKCSKVELSRAKIPCVAPTNRGYRGSRYSCVALYQQTCSEREKPSRYQAQTGNAEGYLQWQVTVGTLDQVDDMSKQQGYTKRQSHQYAKNEKLPSNLVFIFDPPAQHNYKSFKFRIDIFAKRNTRSLADLALHRQYAQRKKPTPVATIRGSGRVGDQDHKPHMHIGNYEEFAAQRKKVSPAPVKSDIVSLVQRFFNGELDKEVPVNPYQRQTQREFQVRPEYDPYHNYQRQTQSVPAPTREFQVHAAFVYVDLPEDFTIQTCIFVSDYKTMDSKFRKCRMPLLN